MLQYGQSTKFKVLNRLNYLQKANHGRADNTTIIEKCIEKKSLQEIKLTLITIKHFINIY